MHALGILLVVAFVFKTQPPAITQEPTLEPSEKTIQDYWLWKARKDFAEILKEKPQKEKPQIAAALGQVTDGKNFNLDFILRQLNTMGKDWPDIEKREATEELKLYEATKAYGEFVDLVIAIRDFQAQNMGEYKKRQEDLAKRPTPPPPSRTKLTGGELLKITLKDRISRIGKESRDESEFAKWRGEIAGRAAAARNAKGTTGKMQDLQKAVTAILDNAKKKFEEKLDKLAPPIAADEFVMGYLAEELIASAVRIEVHANTGIALNDCRKPGDIRVVVYDVTDAFGMNRRASVAVYKDAKSEWMPSNDNKAKGGFYEMRSAQGNQ